MVALPSKSVALIYFDLFSAFQKLSALIFYQKISFSSERNTI